MRLSLLFFFTGPETTATAVALGILLVGGGRWTVNGLRLSFAGGSLPETGGGGLTAAEGFWFCPPDSTFAKEDGFTVAGFCPIAKIRWPITEESFRSKPCPVYVLYITAVSFTTEAINLENPSSLFIPISRIRLLS